MAQKAHNNNIIYKLCNALEQEHPTEAGKRELSISFFSFISFNFGPTTKTWRHTINDHNSACNIKVMKIMPQLFR